MAAPDKSTNEKILCEKYKTMQQIQKTQKMEVEVP